MYVPLISLLLSESRIITMAIMPNFKIRPYFGIRRDGYAIIRLFLLIALCRSDS